MSLLSSLLGYWKFDGNGLDSTPNGRDFTLTGTMPYVAFLEGQGCSPSATNYWNIANPTWLDSLTAHTFAYWVRDSAYDLTQAVLSVGTAAAAASTVHYPFDVAGGNGFKLFANNISFPYKLTSSLPALNSWQHCAVVCESASSSRLYINGVERATNTTNSLALAASQVALRVGMYHNGGQGYSGDVAHLGIWSRALTPTEVATLAAQSFYPFGGPPAAHEMGLRVGIGF